MKRFPILMYLLFSCFVFLSSQAVQAQNQPLCDGVECRPDSSSPTYGAALSARPKLLNARGSSSPIVPIAAAVSAASDSPTVVGSQSFNQTIPVLKLPGRAGMDLSLNLFYNSRVWNVDTVNNTATFNIDRDFPSYGFRLDYGFLEYDSVNDQYIVTDSDGAKHGLTNIGSGLYDSTDGTYMRYTVAQKVLTYKNGTQMYYQVFPSQASQSAPTLFRPTVTRNSNGNFITIAYVTGKDQALASITDTLGRVINFVYDGSGRLSSVSQNTASGVKNWVTFTWGTIALDYNFSLTVNNSPASGTTINVITGCTYPNGTGYVFHYGHWGIINRIDTVSSTAAVRSYTSYNFPDTSVALSDAPAYTQQTVSPDGTAQLIWSYAFTKPGTGVVSSMTVTDPNGNKNVTTLDSNGFLSSVQSQNSAGTPLRTTGYVWTTAGVGTVPSSITTTLNDTAQQSSVEYIYDTYGNATTVSEFDYGHQLRRQTVTTFLGGGYIPWWHILNLPTRILVIDGGSGTTMSRTDLNYDEYNINPMTSVTGASNHDDGYSTTVTTRGNLTSMVRYSNAAAGTGANSRVFTYDTLGNRLTAQLDCCNLQTPNFSSLNQYAYPNSLVRGPVALQFTTSYTYDNDTGLMLTSTDENGQQTQYQFDSMGRPTQTKLPPQNGTRVQLNTAYDDAAVSPTVTTSSTANSAVTVSTLDGIGWLLRTDTKNGSTLVSSMTYSYDGIGQRTKTSNPFAPADTVVFTTTSYDGLGRVTSVAPPSGGSKQFQYAGNSVITTDPAGTQRQLWTSALGWLTEVDEPGTVPSQNNHATMQSDGNFVLYNQAGTALWSTGTAGSGASPMELQDDGNLVLYTAKWLAGVYATPSPGPFPPQTCSIGTSLNAPQILPSNKCITSPKGQYMLWIAPDGNLMIYDLAHNVTTWMPVGGGHPGAYGAMQTDGNFVLYTADGQQALWSSGTNGTFSQKLEMEDDGRIIIMRAAWNSGTSNGQFGGNPMTHPSCDVGFSVGTTGTVGTGQCLVSPNGRFELLLQPADGNMVLYDQSTTPYTATWSSRTAVGPLSPGVALKTTYTYDVLDNLTAVSQASGTVNGQAVAGQPRSYSYDSLGRPTSATTPESGTVTNYYTTSGGGSCAADPSLVCRVQDARGIVKTLTYDGINRLTGVQYPVSDGTPGQTFTYDTGGAAAFALDRLVKVTDGPTNSQTYSYDNLGRIISVSQVIDQTTYQISYGYNLAGQVNSVTYPTGRVVSESFDPLGRLSQISSGSTNYLSNFSYNAAIQPLSFSYGNGVNASFGYNDHLQLSALRYSTPGNTDALNLAYDYGTNNNGQIQAMRYYTSPGHEDTTKSEYFGYDPLSRLSTAHTGTFSSTSGWSLQWAYDRLGNRTQQNILGGNPAIGAPQFTIDPTTNRILNTGFQYDMSGNLTSDGTNSYAYDGANRLKQINSGATSYTYFGPLRIKKVTGSNTTVYVYSGNQPLAEYVNGSVSKEYISGSSVLVTISGTGTTYHHPDHLSNRAETDSSGNIIRTYGHFSFGETWYETGTPDQRKFTGAIRDSESNLDLMGARYYSSALGRFMSADPGQAAGFEHINDPQSWNGYSYARNDPVNLVDPTGFGFCSWDDGSVDAHPEDGGANKAQCEEQGGTWVFETGDSQVVQDSQGNKAEIPTPSTHVDVDGSTGEVTYEDFYFFGGDIPLNPQAIQIFDLAYQRSVRDFGCLGMSWMTGSSGATAFKLGQPVPGSKPFVGQGTSIGTSPASSTLREAFPQRLPFRVPTPVGGPGTGTPFRIAQTNNLGAVAGRFAPLAGGALTVYSVYKLGNCLRGN